MHSNAQACKSLIYNTIITTVHKRLISIFYIVSMNPLELFVSWLAPHLCIACGLEGSCLCRTCSDRLLTSPDPACYRCRRFSPDSQTCPNCIVETSVEAVWAATVYGNTAKDIIALLKFQRAKAAHKVIAAQLHTRLPPFADDEVVVPVPTASPRIRQRGYDQACLIARAFARTRGLAYSDALLRTGRTRQVGASRASRFSQLKGAFGVPSPENVAGKHILLVDDVLTTGATMESAGEAVIRAGAASVRGAVFAH